jgi:hypothetical protein
MFGEFVADAAVPAKRRRRPALSCAECRRRKIKCDRNTPCQHCIQSRNAPCTYEVDHPAVTNRRITPAPAPPLSAGSPALQGEVSTTTPTVLGPGSEAGAFLPQRLSSSLDVSRAGRDSWDPLPVCTAKDGPSEESAQSLADRSRKAEQTRWPAAFLSSGNGNGRTLGANLPTSEDVVARDGDSRDTSMSKVFEQGNKTPVPDTKGSFWKTRFIGQSHWINTFQEVCPRIEQCHTSALTVTVS